MRVLAAVVLAGAATVARAQPSDPESRGAEKADATIERARQLYEAAEAALAEGRFADAARDYQTAYELTKDPALLYKLGSAYERGDDCPRALVYYVRYAREGKPAEKFAELTRQRIAACGGDPDAVVTPDPAPSPPVTDATPDPAPDPASAPVAASQRAAWLMVGGSIAFLTIGVVAAYSADAAERDIEDLYVGLGGMPPTFDARTRARYDDLIAEGRRYERVAWVSFGVAGALAVGAAIRFATAKPHDLRPVVAPSVAPGSAGVIARWMF
jgi:hypothetical protein